MQGRCTHEVHPEVPRSTPFVGAVQKSHWQPQEDLTALLPSDFVKEAEDTSSFLTLKWRAAIKA